MSRNFVSSRPQTIKVYALRKLGEMLKASERATGGEHGGKSRIDGTRSEPSNPTQTLADLGIDKKISSLAQKIADLSDEKVAALAARVETINGAHVGHNEPSDRDLWGGQFVHPKTAETLAALWGITERTIRRDGKRASIRTGIVSKLRPERKTRRSSVLWRGGERWCATKGG
ncbi:MAG: hypothetical protein Q8S00_04770 [Deltaproteobacteria bacterium]|nr:hypothetical protein [Deltaproteobacteria bacterium]